MSVFHVLACPVHVCCNREGEKNQNEGKYARGNSQIRHLSSLQRVYIPNYLAKGNTNKNEVTGRSCAFLLKTR